MLNAMIWALACFGVVAADIALSVVLFSALGVASVFMGFSIDDLDIQLLQAAAQMASFLMALLWWRYLWPRSFMTRRQCEHPLGGGARGAWKRIACVIVIGLALQVVVGYVTDAALSLLPEAAADYSELVEETGMGDTSYLAVLTTVLGAPFCEELLVRGIIFEFSLRAFNPQCRPLWKRRRRASAQDGAMVPWAAPSTWGIAAAIVLPSWTSPAQVRSRPSHSAHYRRSQQAYTPTQPKAPRWEFLTAASSSWASSSSPLLSLAAHPLPEAFVAPWHRLPQ